LGGFEVFLFFPLTLCPKGIKFGMSEKQSLTKNFVGVRRGSFPPYRGLEAEPPKLFFANENKKLPSLFLTLIFARRALCSQYYKLGLDFFS